MVDCIVQLAVQCDGGSDGDGGSDSSGAGGGGGGGAAAAAGDGGEEVPGAGGSGCSLVLRLYANATKFTPTLVGLPLTLNHTIPPQVRKHRFCAMFVSKRSVYQDRLGTNIGKALKKRAVAFSYRHHAEG